MGSGKRDGFYKRDESPYWWTRDPVDGRRKSTGLKDKQAAKLWRAARERMAADPAHAAAEQATLGEWCGRFVAWKEKSGASPATVSVARQKLGHWIRVLGADAPLARLSEPAAFDSYCDRRRGEHSSDHTISKEVQHMLAVLKLAKRARCFAGDLSTLRPPDLHAGYKPRKRALTRPELARLLAALPPHRAALVAVCVALGCRLGEAFRLLPTDFQETATYQRVFVRGTKTEEAERWVPVLSLFRPLLEAALPYLPLEPWGKVQRDIKVACRRAGIEPCSPNDLRRTHATLLAEAGIDADVTRRLLGHTTRNLVDRVYGQPSTEALAELAEAKLLGAKPIFNPDLLGFKNENGGRSADSDAPDCEQGLESNPRPAATSGDRKVGDGRQGRHTSNQQVLTTADAPGSSPDGTDQAGAIPADHRSRSIVYDDVTVDADEDRNTAEAPVAQWTEQRFPKARHAGSQHSEVIKSRDVTSPRDWLNAAEPGWNNRVTCTATSQPVPFLAGEDVGERMLLL